MWVWGSYEPNVRNIFSLSRTNLTRVGAEVLMVHVRQGGGGLV